MMAPSFLLQRCASSALVPALPATTSRYKGRDEGLTSNGRRSSSKGSLSPSALGRGIYAAPGLAMCQGDAEITALQASATHRACSTSISLTLHWSSLPQNTNNLRQPHAEYQDVKLSLPTRLPSSFLKRSPVPRQKMHSSVSSSEVLPQVSLDISMDERTAGDRPEKAQSPLLTNVASSNKPKDGERVGVLLLNLGGPESLEDVQPFLFNLFADPDIIRLPRLFRFLQRPLAQFISTLRAPKSAEGYAAIGGGSPLRQMTAEQADALSLALKGKNLPAKVYVGMRYWHPFTEEAISQIKSDGITRLVVLPLYPQFSISTSGSSLRLLENIFREDEYLVNMQHTVIPSWYQREGYVQAMANLIEKEVYKFENPEEVHIFFSAHGVPVTYVEDAGDPYKAEMEECVELIMNAVKDRGINCQHTLAYQSRVGPVEWLKPYTDVTIRELGKCGIKNLLAVPVSFVSEHIETLEEIDMEYRQLALESGIKNWGRVPALGCEPTFIADLADAVIEALPYVGAMAVSNLEARQVCPSELNGSEFSFLCTLGQEFFNREIGRFIHSSKMHQILHRSCDHSCLPMFVNPHHCHVISANLDVLSIPSLIELFSRGTKYTRAILSLLFIQGAIEKCLKKFADKQEEEAQRTLSEWKSNALFLPRGGPVISPCFIPLLNLLLLFPQLM